MPVEVEYDDSVGDLRSQGLEPRMRQVAAQLETWVNQARATTGRSSLFDRGKYASADNPYDQMRTARKALTDDDVVASTAELTEGLAFDGVKWESGNPDESDVMNQIAAEHDLDSIVRRMWREEFALGQGIQGFWWDQGTFTVRGTTPEEKDDVTGEPTGKGGQKRRKTYKVWYPRAITSLDAAKVVPVGMLQFGQEQLAWQATEQEIGQYRLTQTGELQDELMERFYAGLYTPSDPDELTALAALKVDPERLILLDDKYVHRHCLTKQDYERFAPIRLKSIFRLLDLKQQLMESDRVQLIGAANYILLVKKGSKEDPAYPEEITNLQQNFAVIAKLPVIFSDHRLEIEIITPNTDLTLQTEKYDVLDNRIVGRLLNTITASGSRSGQRADNSLMMTRVIGRSLENRRHLIRRYLEKHIAKAMWEHPKNKGVFQDEPPSLTYVPGRVQLDDDTGFAQSIIQLRTMNELSRESTLEYFGFDQAVEAMRREFEDEGGYDDIFQTMVPHGSPGVGGNTGAASGNPTAAESAVAAGMSAEAQATGATRGAPPVVQAGAGRQGGRPVGGGKPSQNPTKAPRRTARGTTSTKGAK